MLPSPSPDCRARRRPRPAVTLDPPNVLLLIALVIFSTLRGSALAFGVRDPLLSSDWVGWGLLGLAVAVTIGGLFRGRPEERRCARLVSETAEVNRPAMEAAREPDGSERS